MSAVGGNVSPLEEVLTEVGGDNVDKRSHGLDELEVGTGIPEVPGDLTCGDVVAMKRGGSKTLATVKLQPPGKSP